MSNTRIFKLINREGYLGSNSTNHEIIKDIGKVVNSDVYFEGFLDEGGSLRNICLYEIITHEEFQYFEEVTSIPTGKITWEEFIEQHSGIKSLMEHYEISTEEIEKVCTKAIADLVQNKMTEKGLGDI